MIRTRLPYAVMAILLGLNAVPRMTTSNTVRWFTMPVPGPERFASGPPNATWTFGYPFTFYSEPGREFVTKEGYKLFLADREQVALTNRLSFVAIAGNVTLSVCVGIILLIAANRYSQWKGQRPAISPQPPIGSSNPYRSPQ